MKPKVLVVDDDKTYHLLHTRRLKDLGCEVYIAINYRVAMDLLKRHFFHVATLDIRLEDKREENEDGMALLEKLHTLNESTGVIMISGYPTNERVRRAFKKYKVVDFLTKGEYDLATLEASINEAIQQANLYLVRKQDIDLILSQLSRVFNLLKLQKLTGLPQLDIKNILKRLLSQLGPIMTSRATTYDFQENIDGRTVFETRCWSRFLGKAVIIRVGHSDILLNEVESLKKNGASFGWEPQQNFGGLWYSIDGMTPELFQM